MNSGYRRDFSRQFSSSSWEDRVVFYIDEMSSEHHSDNSPQSQNYPDFCTLYPLSPDNELRPSISYCSQLGKRRRSRQGSDAQLPIRRSSVYSSHSSRTRSNSRATPLGMRYKHYFGLEKSYQDKIITLTLFLYTKIKIFINHQFFIFIIFIFAI